jgi:anti-sigma regulatory factor (Ser/Thr protein kinase)
MSQSEKTENADIPNYRIRPSARLLNTIGKDLVKDKFASVVELVKNSYDADSPNSIVVIDYNVDEETLTISVSDKGDGMDLDTVVNKWLVPATSDKLERKMSPKGRALQGRKGIGRFSAAALGDVIYLNTRAEKNKEVSLLLDLNDFSNDKLLEDIPIIIDQETSDREPGTRLEITKNNVSEEELNSTWSKKQRGNLIIELSKLLAPAEMANVSESLGYSRDDEAFAISVEFKGFPDQENETIKIKPLGIINLFDYRIYGEIDSDGNARFEFYNQNVKSLKPEIFTKKILLEDKSIQAYPGHISFDLRVFDRDPASIDDLIARGLKDPLSNESVGKKKAREILDAYYGVSLFRGFFRIRPYGDKSFDWLGLDKERVQNPSMRIGHNQVIGFVGVQPEEKSRLEEKSARDGLVENSYYEGLIFLIGYAMNQLEERRFAFREKSFRGRKTTSVTDRVEDLFDFDGVKNKLTKSIQDLDIDQTSKKAIVKLFDQEFKKEKEEKSKNYERVKEIIALYQGQATLGKITHILLHEGRKHIKVINEVPSRLIRWANELSVNFTESTHEKMVSRSELLTKSSKALSLLFKRIEPLAISRSPNRKWINLLKETTHAISIFEKELASSNISIAIDIPKELEVYATSFELTTIFANLVENSSYWLGMIDENSRTISIEALQNSGEIEIIFSDSGPGFQGSNLELMFEPGFSMKPEGTGLGLALVGEAVARLGGKVKAVSSSHGACFEITLKKEK